MFLFKIKTARDSGYSLLELLICVAIIAILASICIVGYQASLDMSDMKLSLPKITKSIRSYQEKANNTGNIFRVEFLIGTSKIRISEISEQGVESTYENDFSGRGLLKRNHVFKKYRWPDGSEEPAVFIFTPGSQEARGGEVFFGSNLAQGKIFLRGNRAEYEL